MEKFKHHKPNENEWTSPGIYYQIELGHGYFVWSYDQFASSSLRTVMRYEVTTNNLLNVAKIPQPKKSRMLVSMATGQDFIDKTIRN